MSTVLVHQTQVEDLTRRYGTRLEDSTRELDWKTRLDSTRLDSTRLDSLNSDCEREEMQGAITLRLARQPRQLVPH